MKFTWYQCRNFPISKPCAARKICVKFDTPKTRQGRKCSIWVCVCVFRTFTSSFGQIICWAKSSSYLPAEQQLWPHDIAYYKRAWHWRWWLCPASSSTISIHPSKAWKILLTKCSSYLLPYLHFLSVRFASHVWTIIGECIILNPKHNHMCED
jgi:hypothetical protein